MAEMDDEARDAYTRFLEDAENEPIKFIKHDNRAHDDDALSQLTSMRGMEYYGWYWLLAELLAGRKRHYYDVSTDYGWKRLAHDMSCMCEMSVKECKQFITDLRDSGLINRDQYDELHRVTINRISRDALSYAEEVASKKLGAWKTNRRQLYG